MTSSRLARKHLIFVLFCSTIFAAITTFSQLYFDYSRDVDEIYKDFEVIERSYVPAITSSRYNFDNRQLDLLLDGITKLRDIKYIEFVARERDGETIIASAGDPLATRDISDRYPIVYERGDVKLDLGELVVHASLGQVRSRTLNRVIVIVSSNLIKTFLMALCILWIVQMLTTRHLTKIAGFAGNLDIDPLDNKLVLDDDGPVMRAGKKLFGGADKDEIDQLVEAINTMRGNCPPPCLN